MRARVLASLSSVTVVVIVVVVVVVVLVVASVVAIVDVAVDVVSVVRKEPSARPTYHILGLLRLLSQTFRTAFLEIICLM